MQPNDFYALNCFSKGSFTHTKDFPLLCSLKHDVLMEKLFSKNKLILQQNCHANFSPAVISQQQNISSICYRICHLQ